MVRNLLIVLSVSVVLTMPASAQPEHLTPPDILPPIPPVNVAIPPSTTTGPVVSAPGVAAGPATTIAPQPTNCGWAGAEWLFWATSGQPTLVQAPLPVAPFGGALVQGDDRTNHDFRSGLRVHAGTWLGDGRFGVGGEFFFLSPSGQGVTFRSLVPGAPTSPGTTLEVVTRVKSRTELYGAGATGLVSLHNDPDRQLAAIVGYRYLGISDKLTIHQSTAATGFVLLTTDRFRASNDFHGGLVGLSGERWFGMWYMAGKATVALGGMDQSLEFEGQNRLTTLGAAPVVTAGGLLVPPGTPGVSRGRFAVLPEVGLKVGLQLTPGIRAHVGYDFLYLSSIARAGDNLNPARRPNSTDFWIHGINAGLEWRY